MLGTQEWVFDAPRLKLPLTALNWLNIFFQKGDSFGTFGLGMVKALAQSGLTVHFSYREILEQAGWLLPMAGLDFSVPTISLGPAEDIQPIPGRQWGYAMYETTQIPDGWHKKINTNCERLLVPCEHNADVFRKGGVKIPIHVIHGGCDPAQFDILPKRPDNRPYTFLALGDAGSRKGSDIVWQAFWEAFSDQDDVRLLIKSRPNYGYKMGVNSDPRVTIWHENVDSMASVYAQADCFVFPTCGEGWGLPPREAALCGLPVITTRWAGTAEGVEHWAIPLEDYMIQPSPLGGEWVKPLVDEVAMHMRWCYDNREKAREKGLKSAEWLRNNQTWAHAAKQLTELLQEVG